MSDAPVSQAQFHNLVQTVNNSIQTVNNLAQTVINLTQTVNNLTQTVNNLTQTVNNLAQTVNGIVGTLADVASDVGTLIQEHRRTRADLIRLNTFVRVDLRAHIETSIEWARCKCMENAANRGAEVEENVRVRPSPPAWPTDENNDAEAGRFILFCFWLHSLISLYINLIKGLSSGVDARYVLGNLLYYVIDIDLVIF